MTTSLKGHRPNVYKSSEKPETLQDLRGKPVNISLMGDPLLKDAEIDCTLEYISKGWVGVSSEWRGRIHYHHIPVTSVRRVKRIKQIRRKIALH